VAERNILPIGSEINRYRLVKLDLWTAVFKRWIYEI